MKQIMKKFQIEERKSDKGCYLLLLITDANCEVWRKWIFLLGMSLDEFLLLILGEEAAAVASEDGKDTDSMKHPLSSYWINRWASDYFATDHQFLRLISTLISITILLKKYKINPIWRTRIWRKMQTHSQPLQLPQQLSDWKTGVGRIFSGHLPYGQWSTQRITLFFYLFF